MHLATFVLPDGLAVPAARLQGGPWISLTEALASRPASLAQVLEEGEDGLAKTRAAAERAGFAVLPAEARMTAPVPRPGKIFGVGLNYRDHADEQGAKIPSEPVIFAKLPTSIIGPDDDILLPPEASEVDYEAELVVVIGRRGRRIRSADALAHVAGFTCGNDVSARDWQHKKDGRQWVLGKSFDTFAPIGPWIVTADEIPDPQTLPIEMTIAGEPMQSSNTSTMIFPVADLVAYVSQVATLEPGDLIFTGTPSGVGFARKPPRFLKAGDVCEVRLGSIGTLRNRCVQDPG